MKQITVYRFSELSEKAKERAFREMDLNPDWYIIFYEEAECIAESLGIQDFKIHGFDLERRDLHATGELLYKDIRQSVRQSEDYPDFQLPARPNINPRVLFFIRIGEFQPGAEYKTYKSDSTPEADPDDSKLTTQTNIAAELEKAADYCELVLKEFKRYILKNLQSEYDYRTSIEYFALEADANDWHFTENGIFV